jgi:LRR receptor-like serine/threonine-protein kinase FLS2
LLSSIPISGPVADGGPDCSEFKGAELPAGCPRTLTASGGVPLGTVLAIVFGCAGGLALVAFAVVYRQRRQQRYLKVKLDLSQEALLRSEEETQTLRKAWEIAWAELESIDTETIGVGAAGEVFRCTWRGIPVAVKVLHAHRVELCDTEEMDREACMLRTIRHAHIVQFFGAGRRPSDDAPFIVTELMELGSLMSVLAGPPLDWGTKHRFASEVAAGMALVHSLGRMHRDLKSGNILVTSLAGHMRLKVADFGTATLLTAAGGQLVGPPMAEPTSTNAQGTRSSLASSGLKSHSATSTDTHSGALTQQDRLRSRLLDPREQDSGRFSGPGSSARTHTKMIGTPLWMAPEVLALERYGPGADVYSYAIVMWEIAAQAVPWEDADFGSLGWIDELLVRVRRGDRPPADDAWPAPYVRLMKWCWAGDPDTRPRFAEIVTLLREAHTEDTAGRATAGSTSRPHVSLLELK